MSTYPAVEVAEVAWRPADDARRRALLHLLFGPPAAPDVTGRVSPRIGDAGEPAPGAGDQQQRASS